MIRRKPGGNKHLVCLREAVNVKGRPGGVLSDPLHRRGGRVCVAKERCKGRLVLLHFGIEFNARTGDLFNALHGLLRHVDKCFADPARRADHHLFKCACAASCAAFYTAARLLPGGFGFVFDAAVIYDDLVYNFAVLAQGVTPLKRCCF